MIEIKYDPVSVEIQTTLKVNLTYRLILLHVISSQETILRKKRANIYKTVQFG